MVISHLGHLISILSKFAHVFWALKNFFLLLLYYFYDWKIYFLFKKKSQTKSLIWKTLWCLCITFVVRKKRCVKWWSLFAFQNKDAATRTGTDEAARCQPHSTSRHRAPEKEESGLPGTGIGTRGTARMQGQGLEGLGRQPPAHPPGSRAFAPFTCCLTALRIRFTFDALYQINLFVDVTWAIPLQEEVWSL